MAVISASIPVVMGMTVALAGGFYLGAASADWKTNSIQELGGVFLWVLGLMGVVSAGISTFWVLMTRKQSPIQDLWKLSPKPSVPAGATVAGPVAMQVGPKVIYADTNTAQAESDRRRREEELRQKLRTLEETLHAHREVSALLAQFEREAARSKDPNRIAHQLTDLASRLCRSPVLYFAYQEQTRSAHLSVDAGFGKAGAPVEMHFPVGPEMEARFQNYQKSGNLPSLQNYEPLADEVMKKTGVAHFEAWPLLGYGYLGRQGGIPRLLGVVVVLQAGMESSTHRESLFRMMRSTGLMYENALLSQ